MGRIVNNWLPWKGDLFEIFFCSHTGYRASRTQYYTYNFYSFIFFLQEFSGSQCGTCCAESGRKNRNLAFRGLPYVRAGVFKVGSPICIVLVLIQIEPSILFSEFARDFYGNLVNIGKFELYSRNSQLLKFSGCNVAFYDCDNSLNAEIGC